MVLIIVTVSLLDFLSQRLRSTLSDKRGIDIYALVYTSDQYPTRYQEIAAKLEQELRQHYAAATIFPPSSNWRRALR